MEMINLNGVEYVKKDSIKKIENERDEAIEKLQSIINILNVKPEKSKTHQVRSKPDELYTVPNSAKLLWDIRFMNENGYFFTKDNRKLKITIKHVLEMQKCLSSSTTNDDIAKLGKRLNLGYVMIHRLAFNYQNNVFDKFIKQWNQNSVLISKVKKLPVQNNPEKRKEAGIYGIN